MSVKQKENWTRSPSLPFSSLCISKQCDQPMIRTRKEKEKSIWTNTSVHFNCRSDGDRSITVHREETGLCRVWGSIEWKTLRYTCLQRLQWIFQAKCPSTHDLPVSLHSLLRSFSRPLIAPRCYSNTGRCAVTRTNRNQCQACRLKKVTRSFVSFCSWTVRYLC